MFRSLILLTLTFAAELAHAESRSVPVVFNDLSGRLAGDDLIIDYRITHKSWKALADARLRPQLHVRLESADRGRPDKVNFDRELSRQEGTITLSIPSSIGKLRCEVWVSGRHRDVYIDWMDLGGIEVERATLRVGHGVEPPPSTSVEPPPVAPPAAVNWAAEPRIIEACGAAFDGATNEKACITTVKSSAQDPTPIISACENAMDGDQNELDCIRISLDIRKDPTQVIAACESARAGDQDELECLKTAAN